MQSSLTGECIPRLYQPFIRDIRLRGLYVTNSRNILA
jgi:hypothetical protein